MKYDRRTAAYIVFLIGLWYIADGIVEPAPYAYGHFRWVAGVLFIALAWYMGRTE